MMLILDVVSAALVCSFVVFASVWCWIKWTHRHLIRSASNLHPIFPPLPILGHLHYAVFGIEKMTSWVIEEFLILTNKGIHTTCLWIGPYPIICVFGLEEIKKINSTIKVPERGPEVNEAFFVLKNGLLNAPADIWKTTRRGIEPLFHPRNLRQLIPTFNANSKELVERLSEYEDGRAFDVSPLLIDTSIQTVCHLIFGSELVFDPKSEELKSLHKLLIRAPELVIEKIFKFWLRNDALFSFLYKNEIEEVESQWQAFYKAPLKNARRIIKNKQFLQESLPENYIEEQSDATDEGPWNLISVYTIMQQKHPEFSEDDLKSEIINMIIAGSDTISYAVSSCLLMLAFHQDVQERAYEEIVSVMDENGDVTTDDLLKMQYLDQVFKETLRISYIVPFISRRTFEDITLSSCSIPKGSSFLMAHVAPFLDSKIYPEPMRFNPDHFSPENSKGRDKSAFLPFNAGPRHCMGKLYSELLGKTIVVHVLKKFKLSTEMDVYKLKRTLTVFIHNSEGYNISLQRRLPVDSDNHFAHNKVVS